MINAMKKLIVALFAFCIPFVASAYLVYDLSFDGPEFVAGGPVPDIEGAFFTSEASIQAGKPGFDTQVLTINHHHDSNIDGISFTSDAVTSAVITISWDMAFHSLVIPSTSKVATSIEFGIHATEGGYVPPGGHHYYDLYQLFCGGHYYREHVSLSEKYAGATIQSETTFVANVPNHFTFQLDTQQDRWWFYMDSELILTGAAFGFTPTNVTFGAYYANDVIYSIDNFKWEVKPHSTIPEPATMGLLLLGGGFLFAKRKK